MIERIIDGLSITQVQLHLGETAGLNILSWGDPENSLEGPLEMIGA